MYIAVRSCVFAACAAALLALASFPTPATPREATHRYSDAVPSQTPASWISLDRELPATQTLHSGAQPETTWLGYWTFDGGFPGTSCIDETWVSVDNTLEPIQTHVDDFIGLGGGTFGRLVPIEGNQSLWCGLRPDPNDEDACQYVSLPGYGNNWYQTLTTSGCLSVTGDVTMDFLITWDTEPAEDRIYFEYNECDDDWWPLDLGEGYYGNYLDGIGERELFSLGVPDSLHSGSVTLRLLFASDGAWSDQDGLWYTDGAYVLDSLTVRDGSGIVLPTELFEVESVGDRTIASGNWELNSFGNYGDFAAVFSGVSQLQLDPCVSNASCVWAFVSGSTANYSCGGYPGQATVPYQKPSTTYSGRYIDNEIRSPWVPVVGSGTTVEIGFDVYRDLPLDPLVFYVWHLRSLIDNCPAGWEDQNFVYWSEDRDWFHHVEEVGDLIPPATSHLQVALGVVDMCAFWCGIYGTGQCHTNAPIFDNAFIRRINDHGPRWSARDIYLFQDNFPADGTVTGPVRIDMAWDRSYSTSPSVRPGDSLVVDVADLEAGLAIDPYTGYGAAVYAYVGVWPQGQPGKTGSAITSDPFRWPVVDSLVYAGDTWYCVRMDTSFFDPPRYSPDEGRFCLDLNDNLFTPGDTICYVFCAQGDGPGAETTYYSQFTGTTTDMGHALSNPMEVTCLPGTTPASGRRILYVDRYDGLGAQPFFDTAFDMLGLDGEVDRYDILGPTTRFENGPATRIKNPLTQLVGSYHTIIWNAGNTPDNTLRDGTSASANRIDDTALLLTFLDNLPVPGGIYFSGNNLASDWLMTTTPGAIALRSTYMNFDVLDAAHDDYGLGVSPLVTGIDNGCFDHITGPDTLIAYGGCPGVRHFDVLQATGGSSADAIYLGGGTAAAAVLVQQTTNPAAVDVGVVLSGFSFDHIRDNDENGIPARVEHLRDIIAWLGNIAPTPTPAAGPAHTTSLSQNYPNPFNPTTAIEFTVRERAPVTLRVYNVHGQLVTILVDDTRLPGIVHRIEWDGRNAAGQNVASGVYFYRLVTPDYTATRKTVLLK